jgi:hypothetical protein
MTKRIFLFLESLSRLYNISTPTSMSGPKISKHNTQELSLTQNRQEDKTSLWGKRSLIFTHTNNELFQGLLNLTKQKSNALSESFD